jgi:UDP-N-acetyl-D-glucosamine dehydrogenase
MNAVATTLADRFSSRQATVGVIGLGYIGLPIASALVDAGFTLVGFDVDASKVDQLLAGHDYLKHLGDGFAQRLMDSGRFSPTADMDRLSEPDALVLCVPTPLGPEREPDLGYVIRTTEAVAERLRVGQLVVLESTTYPGTTRDIVLPILERSGMRCGTDFFLAYAPEREDPGRVDLTTAKIPRLVGGVDDLSGMLARQLYGAAIETVIACSSAEIAEAAKLLENIYRAVNIAMVNEMKVLFVGMGIDVHEVIDAASSKPFGFAPFRPGPGLGGHCLPIDPFYLAHKARQVGLPTRFIELAGEINRAMPGYVVERTVAALAARGTDVAAARVLVLGLAYKANVDDVRESPSFVIIEQLQSLGASVDYHDPWVAKTHPVRHAELPAMSSVPLDGETLPEYDVVVLATDHEGVDYDLVASRARLVVDTRGVLRGRDTTCDVEVA